MQTHLIFGCGYLGRVVARDWLADGKSVAGLTRSNSEELKTLGVEPILGDVTSPKVFATRIVPDVDTVLYSIGLDRKAGRPMREVYLDGLQNVLDVFPKPRRFIYVSSTSVYGQQDGNWVDETSPTEPREESGQIILECESLLRERIPEAIILRFAGIYGPGRVIRRATIEKGEPFATDPDGWLNLIHVEDGARAVQAAVEVGQPGATYNVADDQPMTRRDFYTEMASQLQASPPEFRVSAERTNRRIANRRMRSELGVELRYPEFRSGLRHAIGGGTGRS